MLTLDRIYQAAHLLSDVVRKTEVIRATNLQNECELYLKAENLQITGSYKVRGSYFKIAGLSAEEKAKGVVACSAGNHAQGVAMAAQMNNIKATIFLPSTAPLSKIEATKSYGAEIKLVDGVYDDAYSAALEFQKQTDAVFIHPFDDVDVIAGQGSVAIELLSQLKDLDAVVVPVGGGGLISGVAYAMKKLNPKCKVYGVQAEGACSMVRSFEKEKRATLNKISTFADGIAVKCPGEITYELCSKYVADVVTVSDNETAAAVLALMEKQKIVAEGAGAVAVAAVMFNKLPLKGKKVCAVVSGGNIDVNILSRVIHRGLLTAGRVSDLTIELLDKPGQLKDVSSIISATGANVTRVNHNMSGENMGINDCYLHLTIETRNHEHLTEVKTALKNADYKLL
ncbi:threonine dehydratase [Elusimicrobium posterum]|uniref:threonine ammonia-lyase n=1 Tax=Elusimicrobium posterum TaxID=3116653 RepID=UPI003C731BD3